MNNKRSSFSESRGVDGLDGELGGFFPFWNGLGEGERERLRRSARRASFARGAQLHSGDECTGVFCVSSGEIRVYIMSEQGREITLYRLGEGDVCMLSASCVLQSVSFDVYVSAETDCECILIDGKNFADVSDSDITVRCYALELAVSRFSDVMWAMQQVLFMSFDRRLAIFLWDEMQKTGDPLIRLTHEQIARYTGSAREVVSRMLKYFATEHIVENSRGGVRVIDKARLKRLALG